MIAIIILELTAFVPILIDCLRKRGNIQKSDTEKERFKLFNAESELTDWFLEPEKFLQEPIPIQFYLRLVESNPAGHPHRRNSLESFISTSTL